MLALSVAYLLVELSFSARLLDAVGAPGRVDVTRIEIWGRLLSGVAVALLLWSAVILPSAARAGDTWRKTIPWLAVAAAISVAGMWLLQHLIISHLVGRSTPPERQAAAAIVALNNGLVDGRVRFAGLPDDPSELRALLGSPEGKAMLAFLPFATGRSDTLVDRARPVVLDIVERQVSEAMGRPEIAFNGPWRESIRALNARYQDYVRAQRSYEATLQAIPAQQEEAWRSYLNSLAPTRVAPPNIPDRMFPQIRQRVRERGIDVAPDWNPNNRGGMDAAVARKVRGQADASWRSGFESRGAPILPTDLRDSAAFFGDPRIQSEWRSKLGIERAVRLEATWSYAQWRQAVWDPAFASAVEERIRPLQVAAEEFREGGSQAERGREAVEAMVVPPIALFFSLVGALAHLAKIASGLVGLVPRLPRLAPLGVWLATFLGLAVAPMGRSNAALEAGLFSAMAQESDAGRGALATGAMRWVMQAQPLIYPVGDTLRRSVLGGITFGVEDGAVSNGGAEPTQAAPVPTPPTTRVPASPVPQSAWWLRGSAQCGGIPVLAHRGARPEPENTAAAIRAARNAGFTGSEIDVQVTSDGVWVLHHDTTTGRVVDAGVRRVSELTADQFLNQARLVTWRRSLDPLVVLPGRPSSLADAVREAGASALEIEVKVEASCPAIARAVREAAPLGGRVRWTSVFPGSARCLAGLADMGQAVMEAGYVGLIVGPPETSVAQRHPVAAEIARNLAGRFGTNWGLPDRWRESANRDYATPEGIRRAAELLREAPRRGIHLPASDIALSPGILAAITEHRMRLTLYADRGDDHLADVVSRMNAEERGLLDALVIDEGMTGFCRRAFGR